MSRSRESIIDLESTHYYHCISRCVRRAWLCGEDKESGKNFDHRREWIIDHFKFLSQQFCIDICAYAVMANHTHLVLKVNKSKALALSNVEVIARWIQVCPGSHSVVEKYLTTECSESEKLMVENIIEEWRARLYSISWFMGSLNGKIARMANKEDDCTGHFWEQRFKSQALLDQGAILSCMLYVDLNPVRAGVARDLQGSNFTSIQERIAAYRQATEEEIKTVDDGKDCADKEKEKEKENKAASNQPKQLLPFESVKHKDIIHFSLLDYLALADWTGRQIHPDKRGFIDSDVPNIVSVLDDCAENNGDKPELLAELGIEGEDWLDLTKNFCKRFAYFASNVSGLYYFANQRGEHWYKGVG